MKTTPFKACIAICIMALGISSCKNAERDENGSGREETQASINNNDVNENGQKVDTTDTQSTAIDTIEMP